MRFPLHTAGNVSTSHINYEWDRKYCNVTCALMCCHQTEHYVASITMCQYARTLRECASQMQLFSQSSVIVIWCFDWYSNTRVHVYQQSTRRMIIDRGTAEGFSVIRLSVYYSWNHFNCKHRIRCNDCTTYQSLRLAHARQWPCWKYDPTALLTNAWKYII